MKRQLLWLVVVLAIVEVAVFYRQNAELVALSRPADVLVTDPAFDGAARAALARRRVSRRVLERVADVAGRRQNFALQGAALERIARDVPDDASVTLRLAEALRAQGRLQEAETIYRAYVKRGERR